MEALVTKINSMAASLKNRIQLIDEQIQLLPARSGDRRLYIGQHRTVAFRFQEAMERYRDLQKNNQDKYRTRIRRQYLIGSIIKQSIPRMIN